MGKWKRYGKGSIKEGPGPMPRKCLAVSDETLRAIATNQKACKQVYPRLNRKTRRTLVKYRQMFLKGSLRYV